MTIPGKILFAGDPLEYRKTAVYEKISADVELVSGRVGAKGSSDEYVKIYETGDYPTLVFDIQGSEPAYYTTNATYDDNYATDGNSVNYLMDGEFCFHGCLKDGETIVKDDLLEPEHQTGKLIKWVGGVPVARALEDASPSGADKDDFKAKWISDKLKYIEEVLTVTANVATMTYTPGRIVMFVIIAGTGLGPRGFQYGVAPVNGATANVNRAAKTATFHATEAATSCIAMYYY